MGIPVTTTRIFNNDALDVLVYESSRIETPDQFFHLVDDLAGDGRYLLRLENSIEWSEHLVLGHEADNAVQIYGDVGPRERVFASDPRLWSYLATVTHREYMSERWPLDGSNLQSRVFERWLMPRQNARSLVRHGIARLWWIPHLTLDDDLSYPLSRESADPFAYSRWILESENRRQYLFEGLIGRTPKLRWAAMVALAAAPDNIAGKYGARELAKLLNLEAGYRNLQFLSEEELLSLSQGFVSQLAKERLS